MCVCARARGFVCVQACGGVCARARARLGRTRALVSVCLRRTRISGRAYVTRQDDFDVLHLGSFVTGISPFVFCFRSGLGVGSKGAPSDTLPSTSGVRCLAEPHLHQDFARHCQCHICTGTGLAPATSAPGSGSPLPVPHLHRDRVQQLCARRVPLGRPAHRRRGALESKASIPPPPLTHSHTLYPPGLRLHRPPMAQRSERRPSPSVGLTALIPRSVPPMHSRRRMLVAASRGRRRPRRTRQIRVRARARASACACLRARPGGWRALARAQGTLVRRVDRSAAHGRVVHVDRQHPAVREQAADRSAPRNPRPKLESGLSANGA